VKRPAVQKVIKAELEISGRAPDMGTAGILDSLPMGMCFLDVARRVLFMNRPAARLLRCQADSARGKSIDDLLDWCDGSRGVRSIEGHRKRLGRTARDKKQGVFLNAFGQSIRIEWKHGSASGFDHVTSVVTLRDVTRELELEDDRTRLAAIAEESPYPVVELNRDAQMVYANPVMIDLLSKFGFNDSGCSDVFPSDLPAVVQRCLQTGKRLVAAEVLAGESCFAWTFCPVSTHQHVRGYGADMTDVHTTQRILNQTADHLRESNRQLDQALQQAQGATRTKSAFLATISHELRTPMNGVIGMTSLLLDTPLTEEQQSFVQTIQQCGETQLTLINDVLECSKIEAGKLELECIDFHLRTTVEDVLAQFAERAQAKGLEITGLVHASVPTALRGDPGRLRQVLTNFVGNAIKFTESGEVMLQAFLEQERDQSVRIRFEVTDTGIGIAEEVQSKLFAPFTQADSSTTRKYGGTGLGLSISKQLVELMGGKVGLRSQAGQGSTFWCTAEFLKQTLSVQSITPAADLSGRRMLIVDDNESNRTLLHHLATGWGMTADQAEDAAAALSCVERAARTQVPYDVAILDMLMPGKDGLQLAKELKAHPDGSRMRLVILTSLIQPGHAELARQAGFTAYLTKPVRHDQLQGCLRAVLGLTTAMTEGHVGSDHGSSPVAALITRHTLLENRPKPRVLVAEDNVVNQKLTVRMLERLGYQPDVVSNGREALSALERSKYEAIVMDCQMPEMDGYEATRRIRQEEQRADMPDKPHIPIIALTANAMQGDRDRCQAAGMDDYLAKPVKTQDLGIILGRWVHAHPGTKMRPLALAQQKANGTGVFDADRMLGNIGGDRDLFTQLLDLFLEGYPAMMHDVQEALAHEDCIRLERSAHTLKGTAANLCASDVVLVAGQLEATGRLGNIKDASGLYVQLERKVQELAVVLKDHPAPDKST